MLLNDLSFEIRGSIFEVAKELGPGLLESVYEVALSWELVNKGLEIQTQVPIPVTYKNRRLEQGFRADILVERMIIIEIKSIEALHDVHKKTLLTYLKLSHVKLGLLVNFNVCKIEDRKSLIRIIN